MKLYYKWILSGLLVVVTAVVVIALPFKNKTTLTWDAVTTNEDGSPATDLAGYKVYYSQTSGAYTSFKDVGNATSTNIQTTIGALKGNWCFVATAYDVVGNESDFSNEVCADFVIKKQKPTNLGIQ